MFWSKLTHLSSGDGYKYFERIHIYHAVISENHNMKLYLSENLESHLNNLI